jgi:hypothetical protein
LDIDIKYILRGVRSEEQGKNEILGFKINTLRAKFPLPPTQKMNLFSGYDYKK